MIVSPQEENLYLAKIARRLRELRGRMYGDVRPIGDIRIRLTRGCEPAKEAVKQPGFRKAVVGRRWGGPWQTAWFLFTVTVPREWRGRAVVALLEPGGEAVAFLDGAPLQGLDANRSEILLPERTVRSGLPVTLAVEAGANDAFGRFVEPRVLKRADLATLIPEVRDYWYDASLLIDLAKALPADSTRRAQIIEAVNASVDAFDYGERDPARLAEMAGGARRPGGLPMGALPLWRPLGGLSPRRRGGVSPPHPLGTRGARQLLAPVLAQPSAAGEQHFVMQGHAHIDVAWLWPLWETVRKCARTFSTVDRYMEEFPDYVFGQSQAQLYAYTKEHYPALYERIRRRVAEGRWEVTGATWVEMDCNLTCGESLIRQALFGRRFYQEEFGLEPEIAWLPDAFGYPACLPQIFVKCGLKYFLTQKMSWNQFNRIPYHTFRWRGIDGTEILTHFPPTDTYNGMLTPAQMLEGARRFSQKGVCSEQLYLFGFGDGGGGPTKQMLESARRTKSLAGLPSTEQGKAHDFFARAAKDWEHLPVWADELYNEFHRGTYTTQARTKRNNRKAELLYREAELWGALASLWGWAYPGVEMAQGWKLILLNQFHDVLPGSSIAEVYRDSRRQFAEVFAIGEKVRADACQVLAGTILRPSADGHPGSGPRQPKPRHLFALRNSLSWPRGGVAAIDAPRPRGAGRGPWQVSTLEGDALPTQRAPAWRGHRPMSGGRGRSERLLFLAPEVPSMGYATFTLRPGAREAGAAGETKTDLKVNVDALENECLRLEFNSAGHITSIFDKRANREVVAPGQSGNQLQLFEDKPVTTDAWDIDIFYLDKPPLLLEASSRRVSARGPVKAALEFVYRTPAGSTIEQEVSLVAGSPLVTFSAHVNWQETDKLLKAAFPVAVHARRATYEIQFGHIDRPTHWSTSWDKAKFEVPAHRWADLSEAGYGVALLNDCKFGYDIKDNVLRLSLLRAPTSPDPQADRGEQVFSYALYPHEGDFRDARVVQRAYDFNVPLGALPVVGDKGGPGGGEASRHSFFSLDCDHVILDTVKPAEDAGGLILRLYEALGGRGPVTLTFGFPVAGVTECDCLERPLGRPSAHGRDRLRMKGNSVTFAMTPFEITTLRVLPR
jgi:alpha-mannosidase